MIVNKDRLAGVHPALASMVKRAAANLGRDVIVIEGVRTVGRQRELFAKGRTTEQLEAAGVNGVPGQPGEKKVTWTLKSKHLQQKDGYAHAVDLAPYDAGAIKWNDLAGFDAIALAMFRIATAFGVRIRWGADWDGDGKWREKGESDSPHFELAGDHK